MKFNIRIVIIMLSVFFSLNAVATPVKLNYSLFFGYMKTLYKLDYQQVTTAFYLVDRESGGVCLLDKVEIVVDNKREKIEFEKKGRLLPFFSENHRKDGAMIEVETANNQLCDLQVTLMAKTSQLQNINFEKLTVITTQLEGVLRKNAGMVGKYFLPAYEGLRFKLAVPIEEGTALAQGYQFAQNGDLLISNKILQASKKEALLNYNVLRITPWIGK
ncbi:DUF2987 domain-containing protein [Psychromonas hadalis]|uniref:DUF2987 domain-containing protein n=1 Tax=Psychromonas hadalis TaxID=211669 RepID=UPI0004902F0A|nr:DUF2987 domain-containing protein [Psychromonas hadalis]